MYMCKFVENKKLLGNIKYHNLSNQSKGFYHIDKTRILNDKISSLRFLWKMFVGLFVLVTKQNTS